MSLVDTILGWGVRRQQRLNDERRDRERERAWIAREVVALEEIAKSLAKEKQ